MRLSELVGETGMQHSDAQGLQITGLASDSRQVAPGYLFAALDGSRARGADFIPEALRQGAVAVLAPP